MSEYQKRFRFHQKIIRKIHIFLRLIRLHIGHWFFGIESVNEALLRYTYGIKDVLNHFGAEIKESSIIHGPLIIHNAENDYSNLVIEDRVHVGRNAMFDLSRRITIKREAVISLGCRLLTHQDVGDRGQKDQIKAVRKPLVIGELSYLGIGVIVLAGCDIGSSTIIGAGSVVTKPMPDNITAVGTPARII